MEYIDRLPFILGSLMAIIVGAISYYCGASNKDTYIRMAISILVFLTLGIYARNSLKKITHEIERKKRLEEEELQRQYEEEGYNVERKAAGGEDGHLGGHKIDLKVDNSNDDFLPFEAKTISRND